MNLYRVEIVEGGTPKVEWAVADSFEAAVSTVASGLTSTEYIVLAEQHNDESEVVWVQEGKYE